jgi:hypothetical protein
MQQRFEYLKHLKRLEVVRGLDPLILEQLRDPRGMAC